MKKLSVVSLLVLASAQTFAFPTVADKVLIKEMRQTVNLMPAFGGEKRNVRTQLEVQVTSNGCTRAEDFQVKVNHALSPKQILTIFRIRPDVCDMVAHPVTITVETTELQDASRIDTALANPLLAEIRFTH